MTNTPNTEQQELDSSTLRNLLNHPRAKEAVRASVMEHARILRADSTCAYQIAVVEVSARNVKSRLDQHATKGTFPSSAGDMPISILCRGIQVVAHVAGERRIIALVSDPATGALVAELLRDSGKDKGVGYEVWDVSEKPLHAHLGTGQLMYVFAPAYGAPEAQGAV